METDNGSAHSPSKVLPSSSSGATRLAANFNTPWNASVALSTTSFTALVGSEPILPRPPARKCGKRLIDRLSTLFSQRPFQPRGKMTQVICRGYPRWHTSIRSTRGQVWRAHSFHLNASRNTTILTGHFIRYTVECDPIQKKKKPARFI